MATRLPLPLSPNHTPSSDLPLPTTAAITSTIVHEGDSVLSLPSINLDSRTNFFPRAPLLSLQEEENSEETIVAPRFRKEYLRQFPELARFTEIGVEDKRYFRNIVNRTRMVYHGLKLRLSDEETDGEAGGHQAYSRAASIMRHLWLHRDERIVGSIPGVKVGDIFSYRAELCVLGIHKKMMDGIDFVPRTETHNEEPIATSVVFSGRYEDDKDCGDEIIYTGHGGRELSSRQVEDQKLEAGNLALERSMHYGIEIRLIKGIEYQGFKLYVYDGLYKIESCRYEVGKSGFKVYRFLMKRMNQYDDGSLRFRFASKLRAQPLIQRPRGYISFDISGKMENKPVWLFNNFDNDENPLHRKYIRTSIFPSFIRNNPNRRKFGCQCVSTCEEGCECALKNGGEFPYSHSGLLLRGKPLVFECGKFCKCGTQCRNRVSQRGLRNTLEVFKANATGWKVRSMDMILAGSFICEFAGVVLHNEHARLNGNNNIIYPARFTPKWHEWGDLSQIFPGYVQPSIPPVKFVLDVSKKTNAGSYVKHSSTPNVMVQNVLYDHTNVMFPHLMLFALEDIPPLKTFSLDYGVPGLQSHLFASPT